MTEEIQSIFDKCQRDLMERLKQVESLHTVYATGIRRTINECIDLSLLSPVCHEDFGCRVTWPDKKTWHWFHQECSKKCKTMETDTVQYHINKNSAPSDSEDGYVVFHKYAKNQ